MSLLRNLTRRKLRTALTIFGIAVGMWALVVMASMANKRNTLIEGGSTYFENKVLVSDASNTPFSLGNTPLPISIVQQIERVPGVAVAVPRVQLLMNPDDPSYTFQRPATVVGYNTGSDQGHETFPLEIAQGRAPSAEDEGQRVAFIGSELALEFDKGVGDTVRIRGSDFTIIGVGQTMLTSFDKSLVVPLMAGQEILAKEKPVLAGADLKPGQLTSIVVVYPEEGLNTVFLAEQIEESIPGVRADTNLDYGEHFRSSLAIFNGIILSVALISVLVGGLSAFNTMTMNVAERVREIGIKRAIGASRGRIMREMLTEAAVIGLVGGVLGVTAGAVFVYGANQIGEASGTVIFLLAPGIAVFAVAFSTVLGAVAGAGPAWRASSVDPVEALRYG